MCVVVCAVCVIAVTRQDVEKSAVHVAGSALTHRGWPTERKDEGETEGVGRGRGGGWGKMNKMCLFF